MTWNMAFALALHFSFEPVSVALTTPIHELFATFLCRVIVPAKNSTWARTHVLRKSTIIHYCWNKVCGEEENKLAYCWLFSPSQEVFKKLINLCWANLPLLGASTTHAAKVHLFVMHICLSVCLFICLFVHLSTLNKPRLLKRVSRNLVVVSFAKTCQCNTVVLELGKKNNRHAMWQITHVSVCNLRITH
jgi:hypothetical protein